jgi:hypothetical protein
VSPIVAALDHPEVTLDRTTVPTVALSLVDAFGQVPDPRKARGIRHGVTAILLLGACAVLTGAQSFAAIAEYAQDTGRTILDTLGVGAVVPHACTIRRVLSDLDPDAVEAAMQACKTVRGAHIRTSTSTADAGTDAGTDASTDASTDAGGYRQPHLVSALDHASGAVLGQVAVEKKGNEIAAFTTLLDTLDLTDVLITADAAHTNRNHAHSCTNAAATTCCPRSATSPRCCADCARCPGPGSRSPPGNVAAVTAGPRPARSAWSVCTPAPTAAASSSRTPPKPSRSSAADAHWAARSGAR